MKEDTESSIQEDLGKGFFIEIHVDCNMRNRSTSKKDALERFNKLFCFDGKITKHNKTDNNVQGTKRFYNIENYIDWIRCVTRNSNNNINDLYRVYMIKGGVSNWEPIITIKDTHKKQSVLVYKINNKNIKPTLTVSVFISVIPIKQDDLFALNIDANNRNEEQINLFNRYIQYQDSVITNINNLNHNPDEYI